MVAVEHSRAQGVAAGAGGTAPAPHQAARRYRPDRLQVRSRGWAEGQFSPGTFDPVTNGHLDIARRAAALFDELVVAVSASGRDASLPPKNASRCFARRSRTSLTWRSRSWTASSSTSPAPNRAGVLVRSMRGGTDFDYEFDMALMNRKMAPEIESLYLISKLENLYISGTRIREVATLGYDVSDLVPPNVDRALQGKVPPGLAATYGHSPPHRPAGRARRRGAAHAHRPGRRHRQAPPPRAHRPDALYGALGDQRGHRARRRTRTLSSKRPGAKARA